ncbi:ABC transporter permease subunit [Burkholderia perseverans]|uniref:ABC transporter permease subunit n=1 Tax=Burkholderia perseverans TaxID=2615214 RepID=UPI001FEE92AD|nr:ABC transporter permease subunit [Burkholderia perseverans]
MGRIGIWLVLGAGVLYPIAIIAFVSSCQPLDFGGIDWHAHSWAAYVRVLFDQDFDGRWIWQAGYARVFARSVVLALLTSTICLVVAFPTALWFVGLRERYQRLCLLLLIVPFLVSLVVRCYGWMLLLADGGLLNRGLNALGIRGELGLLYTHWATLLGLANVFLPFMVLPIYSVLRRLDWDAVDAGKSLGASPRDLLARLVLPAAMPGIRAGMGLTFIPALGSYVVPDLLGGAKSLMVGNLIQLAFGPNRDWPKGAALAVVVLVFTMLTAYATRARRRDAMRAEGSGFPTVFPGTRLVGIGMLLFLYLPVIAVAVMSFNAGRSALVWTGFDLHAYRQLLSDPTLQGATWNSLRLAVLTALTATGLALSAAWAIRSRATNGARARVMAAAIQVPLVVPEIVMAVATLLGFAVLSIDLGFGVVLFAHVVFCLPVAFIPIRASVAEIDDAVLDAAKGLGATPYQTLTRVVVPIITPAIASALMLSFITSLDDFVTTYFLSGAGGTTLPTYIYSMLKLGMTTEINAVSTLLAVATCAVAAAGYWLANPGLPREARLPNRKAPRANLGFVMGGRQ